jgi:hypothetical protein
VKRLLAFACRQGKQFDFEMADPVAMRDEELKPLDLHPRDYLIYAYNALTTVCELLLERQAQQR